MKKAFTELFERVFRSWKTTMAGLFILAFTTLLLMGKITASEFMVLAGGIAGIQQLFARDKTAIKCVLFLLLLSSCCGSRVVGYPDQDIPALGELPVGTRFSVLDEEGRKTTITKIDTDNYQVDTEVKEKKERGALIHVEVHKDKSRTTIDSHNKDKAKDKSSHADNGAVIGKDRSDNKGATDSGNKEVSNTFPWYVWVLLVLLAAGWIWWKFGRL